MEEHQDLARGFVKGDRVLSEELWADLALQLNALGPPTKDVVAWKKVWIDMKLNVKHRMAHNKAECSKTGGGRFNKYILSPTDELLANICGLYASVEGIHNAKSFGVPSNEKPEKLARKPGSPKNNTTLYSKKAGDKMNIVNSLISSPVQLCQNEEPLSSTPLSPVQMCRSEQAVSNPPSTPARVSSRKRKKDAADIVDVMEMETENFSKIKESLDSLKNEMKENRNYLKEVSRNIREIKKIKEQELKEMIRHNYAMENSAQTKNELQLQFLELERLKLGIQPPSST